MNRSAEFNSRIKQLEGCCVDNRNAIKELQVKEARMGEDIHYIKKSLDDLRVIFEKHDEKETQKYEKYDKLQKWFYMALGAFALAQFFGVEKLSQILGG